MRYIKFTYVDAQTGICVNKAPTRNGPKFPEVKGLQYLFALESKYPTDVPEFFGICDDDANLDIDGCFGEITEAEFIAERQEEINARKPYSSWVLNQEVWNDPLLLLVNLWSSPVAMPEDAGTGEPPKRYTWDEETTSWVERETA
jgi:hypothetical protein